MTTNCIALGLFSLCTVVFAENALIENGTFDDHSSGKSITWSTKHHFVKGKGSVEIVQENGNKALKVSMHEPNSYVKIIAGKIKLKANLPYTIRYRFKRSSQTILPNLTIVYRLKDGRSGSEQFQPKRNKNEQSGVWIDLTPKTISAVLWLPAGSAKRYQELSDGKLFFASSMFGSEPLECEVFMTITGTGEIFIDDISIEENKTKTTAMEADEEAERQRLMVDKTEKINRMLIEARTKKNGLKLDFKIPLIQVFKPQKTDFSQYPDSITKISFDNARVLRNGKPVMLLGVEGLDPYTMKMFGMDYWVKSSFMGFIGVQQKNGVMTLSPPGRYPFLESELKHYLHNGILVWIDMLTGKGGRSKPIMEAFPELFTTGGHFFAWNQELLESRAILQSIWKSVLDHTRKYPILFYEMFNEVIYEDKSPANIVRFQNDLRKKYHTIEAFNKACGTNYTSFEALVPQKYNSFQNLMEPVSENLKAEWDRFTEKRFSEVAEDGYHFFRQAVPPYSKISFQSVYGFPDYTLGITDPIKAIQKQDYKGLEITAVFYPQTGKFDDEEAITAEIRANRIVKFFRGIAPEKTSFDGEMSVFPGTATFTKENIVADFGKKMKFCPGATGKNQVKNDLGRKEKWYLPEYDDSKWNKIPIPSMWAKAGYPQCTVGWYRAEVRPTKIKGRRLYLCGNELADRAEIYLNGKLIGNTMRHFEKFAIDVTDIIRYGEKNVIAVRIENTYLNTGYYWGGIRTDFVLLDTPGYSSTRFSPDQMDFLLWQRAMLGYNGTCISYFYSNWADPHRCSLQNPIYFDPGIWAKIPETKNRINDLGEVIYPKRQPTSPVGICFSLDSARAYVPSKQYTSTERSQDFDRWFAACSFLQRDTGVFSDDTIDDYTKLKSYRTILLRLTERISDQAQKNLLRYVKEGGLVFVDRVSMTKSTFDNSPLDCSALLGAKRLAVVKEPGNVRISNTKQLYPTRSSTIRGGGHYAPLQMLDALPFAWIGETPVGAVRRLGKGAFVTISAELQIPAIKTILNSFFEEFHIQPTVRLSGAEYVDVFRCEKDGRILFGVFNWGGKRVVRLTDFQLPVGEYRLRNVVTGCEIQPATGKIWNSSTIKSGLTCELNNFVPALFLFERTNLKPLKLTKIPDGQNEALEKFWKPFWKEPKNLKKRVLWYGRTAYSPVLMSSAVKILRDNGIASDYLISIPFETSNVKVLRKGKPIYVSLNDYDLIILPSMLERLNAKQLTGLRDYLKAGNHSILLLGTHSRDIQFMYPGRNCDVLNLLKAEASWGPVLDNTNALYGDGYFFRTKKIKSHAVTEGVKEFASFGSCAVSIKNGVGLIHSERGKESKKNEILSLCEDGSNRIVIIGDTDWLTPLGLASGDNAVLWNNLTAWLCRIAPLSQEEAKRAAELPKF